MKKRLTGCIVVTDESYDESAVYLRDGVPVQVDRSSEIDVLARVLVEERLLPAQVVADVKASAPADRRFGDLLVERGHLTPAKLGDALKVQLRRKLMRLFHVRAGRFAIYLDPHPYGAGAEFAQMRLDPRCLIYPGIRAAYDEARMRAELAPLEGHTFKLIPALPPALLPAMGIDPADPLLERLQEKALSLSELPLPGARPAEALAAVLALLYTDLLEVTAPATAAARPSPMTVTLTLEAPPVAIPIGPAIPMTPPAPGSSSAGMPAVTAGASSAGMAAVVAPGASSAGMAAIVGPGGSSGTMAAVTAPGASSSGMPAISPTGPPSNRVPAAGGGAPASTMQRPGAPAALRTQIEEMHAKLGTASHFELLGVAESATPEEIAAACMRGVRQLHPDRLASWGLPDLTDKASAVVARLNEAQAVLADPKRRAEYLAARSGKPADTGQNILAAEELYQKGVVYLRKSDWPRAIESFAAAMKAHAMEPSYKVHWMWARFEAAVGGAKDGLARDVLKTIDEALKERPKFPTAHYWAGMAYKHQGDAAKAEACFRTALSQNKNFLEAERELRVLEMRRTRQSQAMPAAGEPARNTPKGPTAVAAKPTPGIIDRLLKR